MLGSIGIISLWDLAGAAVPLALVVFFLVLLVHNAERCSIESVPRFMRHSKWVLITGFFFVLLVTIASYAIGYRDMGLGSFLIWSFVGLPVFFALAYFMGALWMSVLLHMIIRRYLREGRSVEDARDSQAVRKTIASFRWLHLAIVLGSRSRLTEMLDQVCPLEKR